MNRKTIMTPRLIRQTADNKSRLGLFRPIRAGSRLGLCSAFFLLFACGENQASKSSIQIPEAGSKAAMLYVEKCKGCHTVPLPSKHTAKLWPSVLNRMQMRMKSKGVKKLSKEELVILMEYLQKHAKPGN